MANREIDQRFLLRQAGTCRCTRTFVSAAVVDIAQRELCLVRREVKIYEEQRVIRDLPETVIGNLPFPVLLRTLPDAVVQHAERRLELARENRLYIFNHGNRSH